MKSSKKLMVLCLAAVWGSSSILVAEAQASSVVDAGKLSQEIDSINQKLNEHIKHGQAQDGIISDGVRNIAAAAGNNYKNINKLHSWVSELDNLKANHADLDGAVASINNHISSVEKSVVKLNNGVMDLDHKTNERINTTNDRVRDAAQSALVANKGVAKNVATLDEQRRTMVKVSSDATIAKNVAARADSLSRDNRDWINQHKVDSEAMHEAINQHANSISNNKVALEKTNKNLAYVGQKTDVNTKNINTLNQAVTANQADISSLQDKADEHDKSIATNTKNIGILGERTRGNEKDIGELQDRVDSNDKAITKNTTAIHDNQTQIKALASDIADSLDAKMDQEDFVAFQKDQSSKHQVHEQKLVDHDARLDQSEAKDTKHDQRLANHEDRLAVSEQTMKQQGKTLVKHQAAIDGNAQQIARTQQQINSNTADIALLNSKVDYNSGRITKLDDKVNKGLALMSAMSSVDMGGVSVGKIRVAGAVGGYANKQAIAFGVGTALTNDFRLNVKASISTDDSKSSAYSIGASYDF